VFFLSPTTYSENWALPSYIIGLTNKKGDKPKNMLKK